MKYLAFILSLAFVATSNAQIIVPAVNERDEPIEATYVADSIPEGASVIPEWKATEGVHFREPVPGKLCIWAKPGEHEISVTLDWILIDWDNRTFERGRPTLRGQFTVKGKPDDPDDPDDPDPNELDQAIYLYEKDEGPIPPGVMAALAKANEESEGELIAVPFEEDQRDGDGDVPERYAVAYEAGMKFKRPCLVLVSGDVAKVVTVTTYDDVMRAIKGEKL